MPCVGNSFTTSQEDAWAASTGTQLADQGISYLLYLALIKPHLQSCIQHWACNTRKNNKPEISEGYQDGQLAEDLSHENRLRNYGLFSLGKRL